MEIGINFDVIKDLDARKRIEYLKENGFKHVFMDSEDPDFDLHYQMLKENGIVVDNCHAPYKHINDIWEANDQENEMYKQLENAILLNAKYNIPVIVMHLSSKEKPPRINEYGYQRWLKLVELARKHNIKIAFENQRVLANIAFVLEQFEDMGFCWDCGHEACFADGRRYMPLFGDRLIALHLHDNDGIHNHDRHMLPYDCSLDFDYIAKRIAERDYQGTVMLEVINRDPFYKDMNPREFYQRAAKAALRLKERIEYFKAEN